MTPGIVDPVRHLCCQEVYFLVTIQTYQQLFDQLVEERDHRYSLLW
jgi:hypothetical protein